MIFAGWLSCKARLQASVHLFGTNSDKDCDKMDYFYLSHWIEIIAQGNLCAL